jgi:hypothetical protein
MSKKPTKKALKEMQALCFEWQDRLRLNDWEIVFEICGDSTMDDILENREDMDVDTLGTCNPAILRKEARLLLRSQDSKHYTHAKFDSFEATLVHELLHIHFAMVPEAYVILEEQTVETLTKVLLKMKYKGTKP